MREKTTARELLEEFYGPEIEERFQEGIQQGRQTEQREAILFILEKRFKPSEQQVKSLTEQLKMIQSLSQLKALFGHAVDDFSITDFQNALEDMVKQAKTQ